MSNIPVDEKSLVKLIAEAVVTAVQEEFRRRDEKFSVSHTLGVDEPVYGNAADERWGYCFGCEGLMNASVASKFLSVSDRQLDRLAAEGHIRKGRMPANGHRTFCKKSIGEFAQKLEL